MTDKEIRGRLERLRDVAVCLETDVAPLLRAIEDWAIALEANPLLAEVEGWVYVADTCIYIGADGMIMIRREMLPDVKEGDQLTVTIRGKP